MSRFVSQTELIKESFRILSNRLATAVPAYVVSYDPTTQYAQVQIGVMEWDAVAEELFDPAVLIECYVQSYGSKWHIETEIQPGDEGMLHFSQRCIDGWMTTGGIAVNPRPLQAHNINDCVFYPGGARSEPNRLPEFNNDGIRIRNQDGTHYMWIKNTGEINISNNEASIVVSPAGGITISGSSLTFDISGAVDVNSSALNHNGTNVGDDHEHTPGDYNINGAPVVGDSGVPS